MAKQRTKQRINQRRKVSGEEARVERPGFRERICRGLDIPPDLLPGAGLVEIRGRNSVTVKGCGRILVYTPEEIRIGLKSGCLSVTGKRLVCTSYYAGAVGIDGYICRVSFEEV